MPANGSWERSLSVNVSVSQKCGRWMDVVHQTLTRRETDPKMSVKWPNDPQKSETSDDVLFGFN